MKLRTNILPKSCRFSAPGVALMNPVCVTARTSHNTITNGISSMDTVFSRTTPPPTLPPRTLTGGEKTPYHPSIKILIPPRLPEQPQWPEMGVKVKIWYVLM